MVVHESIAGEGNNLEEEDNYNYDFAIIVETKKTAKITNQLNIGYVRVFKYAAQLHRYALHSPPIHAFVERIHVHTSLVHNRHPQLPCPHPCPHFPCPHT